MQGIDEGHFVDSLLCKTNLTQLDLSVMGCETIHDVVRRLLLDGVSKPGTGRLPLRITHSHPLPQKCTGSEDSALSKLHLLAAGMHVSGGLVRLEFVPFETLHA